MLIFGNKQCINYINFKETKQEAGGDIVTPTVRYDYITPDAAFVAPANMGYTCVVLDDVVYSAMPRYYEGSTRILVPESDYSLTYDASTRTLTETDGRLNPIMEDTSVIALNSFSKAVVFTDNPANSDHQYLIYTDAPIVGDMVYINDNGNFIPFHAIIDANDMTSVGVKMIESDFGNYLQIQGVEGYENDYPYALEPSNYYLAMIPNM